MKKIRIIITSLMIVGIILTSMQIVSATTVSGVQPPPVPGRVSPQVNELAGKALGIGQVICYTAGVILIMWMGVKWLNSAPEGKAEMKKGLIQAAVASALLVGAGAIMTAVGNGLKEVVE